MVANVFVALPFFLPFIVVLVMYLIRRHQIKKLKEQGYEPMGPEF